MEVTFVTDVKFSKFKSKGKLDKTYYVEYSICSNEKVLTECSISVISLSSSEFNVLQIKLVS